MKSLGIYFASGFALTLAAGFTLGYVVASPRANRGEMTYLERLARDYDLTPAQRERVRGHLEDEDRAIVDLLQRLETGVRDEVRKTRVRTMESIRAELDASQRLRFDQDVQAQAREARESGRADNAEDHG